MKQDQVLDRREFTVAAALAMLGGATITISGCGGGGYRGGRGPSSPSGGDYGPVETTPPAPTDVVGSISANHGHTVTITGAQLQAGGALTLVFAGSATHAHSVSLSAAEVVAIRNRQRVSKPSTDTSSGSYGTHSHTVTFN